MADSKQSRDESYKGNSTVKKNLSYGRNKNEGLIASRNEMEKGIQRILRDIKS